MWGSKEERSEHVLTAQLWQGRSWRSEWTTGFRDISNLVLSLKKKYDFRNNKGGNCYPNSSPRYKLDQPSRKGVSGTPAPIPQEVGLEGKVFKFMIDDINSIRQTSQAQFLCSWNAHSLEFPFPFYFFMRMLWVPPAPARDLTQPHGVCFHKSESNQHWVTVLPTPEPQGGRGTLCSAVLSICQGWDFH